MISKEKLHLDDNVAAAVNGECFAGDNNLMSGHGSMLQAVHQHNKLPGKRDNTRSLGSLVYFLLLLLGNLGSKELLTDDLISGSCWAVVDYSEVFPLGRLLLTCRQQG